MNSYDYATEFYLYNSKKKSVHFEKELYETVL